MSNLKEALKHIINHYDGQTLHLNSFQLHQLSDYVVTTMVGKDDGNSDFKFDVTSSTYTLGKQKNTLVDYLAVSHTSCADKVVTFASEFLGNRGNKYGVNKTIDKFYDVNRLIVLMGSGSKEHDIWEILVAVDKDKILCKHFPSIIELARLETMLVKKLTDESLVNFTLVKSLPNKLALRLTKHHIQLETMYYRNKCDAKGLLFDLIVEHEIPFLAELFKRYEGEVSYSQNSLVVCFKLQI